MFIVPNSLVKESLHIQTHAQLLLQCLEIEVVSNV